MQKEEYIDDQSEHCFYSLIPSLYALSIPIKYFYLYD